MPFVFTTRFYTITGLLALLFLLSWKPGLDLFFPQLALTGFVLLLLIDFFMLFITAKKPGVTCSRLVQARFSIGDQNKVELALQNKFPYPVKVTIVDELPEQFEARNQSFTINLQTKETNHLTYYLRPVNRGVFHFGSVILWISSPIGLVKRIVKTAKPATVKVYPAFFQLRKYAINAMQVLQQEAGETKLRKIGHSMEFEQIKDYVLGDDLRALNWKATARSQGLKTNHFADERSQQVYCIIDKGRLMRMPFEQLSLLDYAINASLVLGSVSIKRQDKFGLISFSHQPGDVLVADRRPTQMALLMELLYRQETRFLESNFEWLYKQVRTTIKQRSLLVLFTNFESKTGMRRQLPYLKLLAKHHLLLVIFFENSELSRKAEAPADNLETLYEKTIAQQFVSEKRAMVRELQQHNILSLLTIPQKLTVQTVNKYLELKSRQAI